MRAERGSLMANLWWICDELWFFLCRILGWDFFQSLKIYFLEFLVLGMMEASVWKTRRWMEQIVASVEGSGEERNSVAR